MDNHYLKLGIHDIWTARRLKRLAGYLNETEYEIASRIMLPHKEMKKYLAKDSFPPIVSWCLTLLEVCLARDVFPDCPVEPGEEFFPSIRQ